MRNLLISMIALCILASAINCGGQKQNKIMQADIKTVYEQNLKDSILTSGWYYIVADNNGFKRQLDKSEESYFINPHPILVKECFDKVALYESHDFKTQSENQFGLSIQIKKNYEDLWADATEKSIGKRLGLIIDNKLVNAPMVNARIEGGMSSLNRGVYNKGELEKFKIQIEK